MLIIGIFDTKAVKFHAFRPHERREELEAQSV